jgi:hypothetical protein
MERRKRSRVEPTDEWKQLELLCAWEEQREYERIRPPVLFGGPVFEWAAQTETPESRLLRSSATLAARVQRGSCPSLSLSPGETRLMAVTNPRLFATRHRSAQLKLFALEEVVGEEGWAEVLGLEGYAARSRHAPPAAPGALFSYLEVL